MYIPSASPVKVLVVTLPLPMSYIYGLVPPVAITATSPSSAPSQVSSVGVQVRPRSGGQHVAVRVTEPRFDSIKIKSPGVTLKVVFAEYSQLPLINPISDIELQSGPVYIIVSIRLLLIVTEVTPVPISTMDQPNKPKPVLHCT